MGCYLGVAECSDLPPKFIHLVYKPLGGAKKKVCLVGKGLTFDSGRYNIKLFYTARAAGRGSCWAGRPEFPEILKTLHEHGFELANAEACQEPETHTPEAPRARARRLADNAVPPTREAGR